MHLKSVKISNIRSFDHLRWEIPNNRMKGWHVIIGDNGAGKSTFLRSVALALCGPKEIQGLRDNWETWSRIGAESASTIELTLEYDKHWDDWKGRGRQVENYYLTCGFYLKKSPDEGMTPTKLPAAFDPTRHIWSRKPGWFSASYGPFRRFTGGDADQRLINHTHSILARHITVFGENMALTEPLEWLSQLRFEELDGDEKSGKLLKSIKNFINQKGFLPHGVQFEAVTSKSVVFRNPEGAEIDVTRLSDGFRSLLSMTFELIRQIFSCYPKAAIFDEQQEGVVRIMAPGVVLIDEIDSHLHPTWQRRIGFWLTDHFPELQFIVTSHSPLVCQASERGSVFRLPTPGSEQDEAGFVTGPALQRLVHGDVLDAYGTELFGTDIDRSESTNKKLEELSILNQKAVQGSLTSAEALKHIELKKSFSAHFQSPL